MSLLRTSTSLSRYWGSRVLTRRGIWEEEEERLFCIITLFLTRKCSVSTKKLFANLSKC